MQDREEKEELYFWGCGNFSRDCVNFLNEPETKDDATTTTGMREDSMVKTMHKIAERQKHQERYIAKMLNIIALFFIFVIVLNGEMYILIIARLHYNEPPM